MYCPNCGSPAADGANFCSKCGTRLSKEAPHQSRSAKNHSNYTMYEVFDSTNAVSTKLNGFFDKILNTENSPTTINRFVLTDRSIITDFGEFPYERVSVLAPSGITRQMIGEGFSAGSVYITIDGKQYHLHHTTQDAMRFYYAAIHANERITKISKRQLMQCMCMYYAYLLNAKTLIEKLPVKFEGELSKEESQAHFEKFFSSAYAGNGNPWDSMFADTPRPAAGKEPFDEFMICNSRVTVKDGVILSPEAQQLIATYTEMQEKFNQFLKQYNPIHNSGENRSPFVLGELIGFMKDSDPDASAAIEKYNEKIRKEREQAAADAARRRERYAEEREYRYSREEENRHSYGQESRAKEAKRQADRAEYERKHEAAKQSQREWRAVHKANMERRKKGQPEIPYPPRRWD